MTKRKRINHRQRKTIWCDEHGVVELPTTFWQDDVTMFCLKCEEEMRAIQAEIQEENKYEKYLYE